jgi:peptidoglycan/LPS O-acetylase OafA/YrhL
MPLTSRLPALDSLRAFAIIIVLLYHYKVVVSNEDTFGYITQIGWMGVDLFFVLSGYLIGDQILRPLLRGESFAIGKFYARRLLRTLPNYYAVCLLYIFGPDILIGHSTSEWWRFLTFTQNFDFRPGVTFSHSWSLCIEEQFYLAAPLVFVLAARCKHQALMCWLIIVFGLGMGVGSRINAWFSHGEANISLNNYYHFIYYSSLSRFDELLPGLALALIKNAHPLLFQRLLARSQYWLGFGLAGFTGLGYAYGHLHVQEHKGYNFFLSTFGYSCLALSFMCIVLSALAPSSFLGRRAIPGAGALAIVSYALYLIHKPLFKLLIAPLESWGIDVHQWLGVTIIFSASLVAACALFYCIETPFMILRRRWLKS